MYDVNHIPPPPTSPAGSNDRPPLPITTIMGQGYYDLGSFHRQVTTVSRTAQTWFDRGLIWTYGFNHEEAARCFEAAIRDDANCAMAYWGLALALGPNYNKPWHVFDSKERKKAVDRTRRAAANARAVASHVSPVEKSLIGALQFRYPPYSPVHDYPSWNRRYADAMERVYSTFPGDLDVATLYADALMNLTPWELWDIETGKPAPVARTAEIQAVFDRALTQRGALKHPGLLHFYIHLMEMSPMPERALAVADYLRGLVPDAGHLNHMPTHLDILCGDYRRAIASNIEAIRADERFLARRGSVNFYTLYRSHDYHFCIYAAMFAGQSRVALDTVQQLETSIPEELLRVESPPMADWLEAFLAIRLHVLVRFGRWADILNLELPQNQKLYCVTTTTMHYARGLALAATGSVQDAEKERVSFHDALKLVSPSRRLFNNSCIDVLLIGSAMLDGELEYRRGNVHLAFSHLRHAIKLEHELPYDEPWGWMQPVRHAYGALLLEQGHMKEALRAYRADLGIDGTLPRALQHPSNVWALHGYYECLTRLGEVGEAQIVRQQLTLVAATADVDIASSCYCRRGSGSKTDGPKCCI